LPTSYCPELEILPELNAEDVNYYQSVIGVLRWAVELGRVDITTEVSMLSSHLALPCDGHLVGTLHLFAYLDKKHNAQMVFDPTYPVVDKSILPTHDWKDFMATSRKLFLQMHPHLLVRMLLFVVLLMLTTLVTSYPDVLAQDSLFSSKVPRLFGIPNARLRLKQALLGRTLSLQRLPPKQS
jgi:hypothetical protein